jgi:hypothetical protein
MPSSRSLERQSRIVAERHLDLIVARTGVVHPPLAIPDRGYIAAAIQVFEAVKTRGRTNCVITHG